MKNEQEFRREQNDQHQATFDFDKEDKQEKIDWIENVIFPMLED